MNTLSQEEALQQRQEKSCNIDRRRVVIKREGWLQETGGGLKQGEEEGCNRDRRRAVTRTEEGCNKERRMAARDRRNKDRRGL